MIQITPANFAKIVDDAFSSHTQETRDANQKALEQFMQADSNAFVKLCSQEFQNTANNVPMRVTISTLLKGAIAPSAYSGTESIWTRMSADTKEEAKTTGLTLLMDPNDSVRKAAASLVSKVFAIDWRTDKTWGGLIPIITENLQTDNKDVKRAATLTLGYICEDLMQYGITDLPPDQVQPLLGGICEGLKTYDDLTNTAVTAMSNSINFLASRLQEETISSYIFTLVMNVLINAKKERNTDIIINVLNLLGELCRIVYASIDKYYQAIVDQVLECYQFDVVVQVNEFFSTLAVCEQANKKGVFDNNWNKIVDELFKVLLVLEIDEDDESGLSKHASVLILLVNLNTVLIDKSLEYLVKFFAFYIEQKEEKAKIAALVVLESIIETAPANAVYTTLDNAFFPLLTYITTGTMNLKKHALRTLEKIAKEQTEVFLADYNFLKAHDLFKRILTTNSHDEDTNALKQLVCGCYDGLAMNYKRLPKSKVETFKSYSQEIISLIMGSVNANSDITYHDVAFATLFPFLGNVIEPKQLDEYFMSLFNYLVLVCNSFVGNAKKQAVMHVLINLSVIMSGYQAANRTFANVNSDQLVTAFNYVIDLLSKIRDVSSEGLVVLSNLICLQPELFADKIDTFVMQYIVVALKGTNDVDLFKSGVESIGILAKHVGPALHPYINDVLTFLLTSLHSSTLRQDVRITCFMTISDLCLHYPEIATGQLANVLATLEMAQNAVLVLQSSSDPDSLNYGDSLKDVVLECHLCIVHGIYYLTNDMDAVFEPAFRKLVEFIAQTVTASANPTIDYLKNCLCLLVDIYSKNHNGEIVSQQLVESIYTTLAQASHLPGVEEAMMYAKSNFMAGSN